MPFLNSTILIFTLKLVNYKFGILSITGILFLIINIANSILPNPALVKTIPFCLLTVIPYVWIWAFYRIEKLRFRIVIAIGTGVVSAVVAMLFPYSYGLLGNLIISIVVPIYFIRQWSYE